MTDGSLDTTEISEWSRFSLPVTRAEATIDPAEVPTTRSEVSNRMPWVASVRR